MAKARCGRPAAVDNKVSRYLQRQCGGYAHVARNLNPPLCRQAVAKWGDRNSIPDHHVEAVKKIAEKLKAAGGRR